MRRVGARTSALITGDLHGTHTCRPCVLIARAEFGLPKLRFHLCFSAAQ